MKKIAHLVILILAFHIHCYSQFSKTHYIPPLSYSNSTPVGEQYLYISCPSITPIDFQIKEIGGAIISGTVSRDNPYVYDISSNNPNQLMVDNFSVGQVFTDKGFIIEAQDIVYVTVRVISQDWNQSGELVSKGLAALGKEYRIGGFLNTLSSIYLDRHYTFATVLATENNTTVSFSNIKAGAVLVNNTSVGNTPPDIVLNAGESYVLAVSGPTISNKDALIGALVSSDKPIVVNCGSIGGTNGEMQNMDYGFDQIVSSERTGKDYIFIKSTGLPNVERILLIANENNTNIYLSGSTTPSYTINAGQYIALNGNNYNSQGNLFVHSDKNIFAYQSVGDNKRIDQANQEMFFVPPLSCQTPKEINNIPMIEQIGSRNYTGRVTITTKTSSPLNFIINGTPYTLASLPSSVSVVGPTSITGNTDYECYTISGLTGNISVMSTTELYLAAYGSDGAATFGGYYSGFTFNPEVTFQPLNITQDNCIPNIELKVSSLSGFDFFQWYFNGVPIVGANSNNYSPTQPGYYYVSATLISCSITLESNKIPVSSCATDEDNDGVNDNLDFDNDNDGITNCTESFGNQDINISNLNLGTISVESFSNSFIGQITTSGTVASVPFVGSSDGSFISEVPAGNGNSVKYEMTFAQPMNVGLDYILTANPSDLLNSDSEFIVNSSINKTVSVINPTNQLLIDTNYDGIYESGVTQFSSFEIRFRLNSSTPLIPGNGTFKFLTNNSSSISFTHKNLSLTDTSKASLKIFASCVPKDSDSDGIADQYDKDSDNDGILDNIEAQGNNFIAISNVDANNDGIDDAYGLGISIADNDNDTVYDYLDLDSDNDGIWDLIESGSNAIDSNNNGIIDGTPSSFGINGLSNSIETTPNSGIVNYTLADSDADGINNFIESDSDNDGCNDVIEVGFTDANNDSFVGNNAVIVNFNNGVVTNSSNGYTTISSSNFQNYDTGAPILITTQPINFTSCEHQNAVFSVVSNVVDSYQWQVSIDGGLNWATITNNLVYSGATTPSLTVSNVLPVMSGYKYRVILNKNFNACGKYSSEAILTTYALPTVTSPITLTQCDNSTPNGITDFNLTEKNNFISINYTTETFTYFTTFNAANTNDTNFIINNPTNYSSTNGIIWVRVENANGCFSVAKINLIVSITQINSATFHKTLILCDDSISGVSTDSDGTSVFDMTSVTSAIYSNLTPPISNYTIKYYQTEADALAETNIINSISNFRNTVINQQTIYVRVDSNLDNACFGLGPFVTLKVEALPIAHAVTEYKECDDSSNDGIINFNTSTLESKLLQGQTNISITYIDASGNPLKDTNGVLITSPFPSTFSTTSQTITAIVKNLNSQATDGPCKDEVNIKFTVNYLPKAFPINSNLTTTCDDEQDPMLQDGYYSFDTTSFQSTILNGQSGLNVKYFDANGNDISPLPNPFKTKTQTLTVVVENPLNTLCNSSITILFTVYPLPKIELTGKDLTCTNLPTFTTTIDAGLTDGSSINNYTYQWFYNGSIMPGKTTYSLTVSNEGIYRVDVLSAHNCKSEKKIEVVSSDIAHLKDVAVVDLSDLNSIEIIVTGSGDYVYSIDDSYGPYQSSPIFENVTIGFHTVYIKDNNGCGIEEKLISVLGAPKYFTPNGDGYNDYWNIKGISAGFYSNTEIHVFDRYGKLIYEFSGLEKGWDGTYNGVLAPSDDYWYSAKFENGRTAKGHFSLKR